MTILITGSRSIPENESAYRILAKALADRYPEANAIVHGGAAGADQLAARYARERRLREQVIRPEYDKHFEKAAPLVRNTALVQAADAVIAVYGPKGKTGGTWDTVKKAIARNLPVTEILPDGQIVHHAPIPTLGF